MQTDPKIIRQLIEQPIPGVDPLTICNTSVLEAFQLHALEAYPHECVGAVVAGRYVRLDNASDDPENNAIVSPEVMVQLIAQGLEMILHSHPNGPNCPSGADLIAQRDCDVPFGLICTNGESYTKPVFWGDMLARPALLGRPFVHGITDCVGLIGDYERVVNGREFENPARDWEWWVNCPDEGLYEQNFRDWGYRPVEEGIQPGDIVFLRAGSKVANHAAIYIGDHLILHHLAGRMENDKSRVSTVEPIIRWQQHQRMGRVVRHGG